MSNNTKLILYIISPFSCPFLSQCTSFSVCEFSCRIKTIIRTGITSTKIPWYMRDWVCRWRFDNSAKLFWIYVKNLWIFQLVRNCIFLIGLSKHVFMNRAIILFYLKNKTKLVPVSFSCFLNLLYKWSDFCDFNWNT